MTPSAVIDAAVAPAHRALWRIAGPMLKLSYYPTADSRYGAEIIRPADGQRMIARLRFWGALMWTVLVELFVAAMFMSIGMFFAYKVLGVIAMLMPSWWDPFLIAAALVPVAIALPGLLVIQLRYDQIWYSLDGERLRVHEGLFISREATVSYANIQNVSVRQGPLQRLLGIGDVVVQSAGGQAPSMATSKKCAIANHIVRLRGIANAREVRDSIMVRARQTGGARPPEHGTDLRRALGARHVEALGAIRTELALLAQRAKGAPA